MRFDGWVTELHDEAKMIDTKGDQSNGRGAGIDNLLYSAGDCMLIATDCH